MRLIFRFCFLFVIGLFLASVPVVLDGVFHSAVAQSADVADSAQVQQVRQALFDSMQPGPDGPPASALKSVDQIQVQGNYAVAHWTWGENAGGWALLQKAGETWLVTTRRSDAISPQAVTSFGVPADVAQALVNAYDPNWSSYEPLDQTPVAPVNEAP